MDPVVQATKVLERKSAIYNATNLEGEIVTVKTEKYEYKDVQVSGVTVYGVSIVTKYSVYIVPWNTIHCIQITIPEGE